MASREQSPAQWPDKLTIDTPEQTPLEFPLAGIGSRFLAIALDTLIQAAGFFFLFILAGALSASIGGLWTEGSVWVFAAAAFVFFLIYAGYFAIFEAAWNGQTPGKRLTRLRVIQESGRPISVYQAIARNLLRFVDQLPFLYGVGIISALISRQNKRLGDYVAGTVVVHEKPFEEVRPEWGAEEKAAAAEPYGARRLNTDEVQLIEAFLQRRAHLGPDVRSQMARQIADRVAQRLGIPPEQRRSPALPGGDEAFLEMLAEERRTATGYR